MYYSELVTSVNDYLENNFPTEVINRFIEQSEKRIYNLVHLPALRRNSLGQVSVNNPYISIPSDWLATYSMAIFTYAAGDVATVAGSNVVSYIGIAPQVGQEIIFDNVPPNTYVTAVGTNSCQLSANALVTGTAPATFQGPYYYLLQKNASFIREAFGYPSTFGQPVYYALYGPQVSNPFGMSFLLAPTPDQTYSVELQYNSYPQSIIQAQIGSLGAVTTTGLYTSGTYYNQPLTGGTGSGATANIKVINGTIASVSLQATGCNYAAGDILSANLPYSVGSPTLSIPVSNIINPNGESWLGDNFDVALFNYVMMEAITYIKGEQDLVILYKARADDAVQLLNMLGENEEKLDGFRQNLPKYKT
jgi:hypothetical protein